MIRLMVLIAAAMGSATLAGLTLLDQHRVAVVLVMVPLSLLVAAAEGTYLIWRISRAPRRDHDRRVAVMPVLAVASAPACVMGALCADMFLRF